MSTEDDQWCIEHLKDSDDIDSAFGVGSYRYRDDHGVVHRVSWTRRARGWTSLCGATKVIDTTSKPDPGAVTCLQCLGEGA